MSFYPRSEADKGVYRRGALPWVGFIQQCVVAAFPPLRRVQLETPGSARIAQQRATHERYKEAICKNLENGPMSVQMLTEVLGIARSAINQYCGDLSSTGVLSHHVGAKQTRYFTLRGST